jgi:uracil-DNA glycosylase
VSCRADDGLQLIDCRITNAVKCLPPENKPETERDQDLQSLAGGGVAPRLRCGDLALGAGGSQGGADGAGLKQAAFAFAHGARHVLPDGRILIDSYHCSRYNTQTRRLTSADFHDVFRNIRQERLDNLNL